MDFWWTSHPLSGNVFLHSTWAQGLSVGISEICFPQVLDISLAEPNIQPSLAVKRVYHDMATSPMPISSPSLASSFLLVRGRAPTFPPIASSVFWEIKLSTRQEAVCFYPQKTLTNISRSSGPALWPMWGESTKTLLLSVLLLTLESFMVILHAGVSTTSWHSGSPSTPLRRPLH